MFTALIVLTVLAFAAAGPHNCGPNEVWSECSGCELKCGQGEDTPCAYMCGPPKCQCADGMRRAPNGRCIPASQCPQNRFRREAHECGPNEQWTQCGGCEGTCQQRLVPCTRNCRPPACECLAGAGFVRDANGKCIKFEDCPK